jgi:YD repeat-containing protein
MQYDLAGNLINEIASTTQQQYTYDFLNRLAVCVDYANNTTRYRYDALGRRITKNYQGFSLTHYVYDGDRLIQERDGI